MQGGKRKDDDIGEADSSPFAGLRKNVVLRDAIRHFNEPQLQTQKCALFLAKILFLLQQGETLSNEEAVELFFSVTKLFQSADQHLRRLTYLMIKELKIDSDSSLIVVACLSKDLTSKVDLFRANSIRVLAKIMDSAMVGQMERFLKQSLVDKNAFIVASTLVACEQLWNVAPDVIKRWVNEIQEALNSKAPMVQYHALALLHKMKQNDKLAINKVVSALARTQQANPAAASPYQQCLTIRIIFNNLQNTPTPNPELQKYLVDCLHNKSPMVQYEAARAISRLDNVNAMQVIPAISVLQEFLSSSVPVQRFAAVRTLSEIVTRFPHIVAPTVVDLEHLINDNNRSIATLAITTLLKTGVEANVDRLMKSISGFMADIQDEFKIVLVDAIRQLALKFPAKFPTLLNFLSSCLREEGGFKYKKALVDAMMSIINEIKDAAEVGLEFFGEFIEDCEFGELCVSILHLLGDKGPKAANPARYIRYIFNRVILEAAVVRVAAVASLAKFGMSVPSLQHQVIVLLKRCLNDNDDEVRDRALFYLNVLQNEKHNPKNLVSIKHLPPLASLEHSLNLYLSKSPPSVAFNVAKHLVHVQEETEKDASKDKDEAKPTEEKTAAQSAPTAAASASSKGGAGAPVNPYVAALKAIPEIAALGEVFKSSAPVELTESETEYVVNCIKHILPRHLVFQFNVTNNIEDQVLQNVRVEMETDDEQWTEEFTVNEAEIKPGQPSPGSIFVAFNRPENVFGSGSISCTLHFTVKELQDGEVSETGHEDEYQLEDVEVTESDFMRGGENIGLVEFKRIWETQFSADNEVMKKYSLGLDGLQSAVNAIMEMLGMVAIENSAVVPEAARSHAANLTGLFFGNIQVLARAAFVLDAKHGVTLKIVVRSSSGHINNLLTAAIR